jgi:AcrR family transcriptional regulator
MSTESLSSLPPADAEASADDELVRSGRDAAATRRALVRAARRRFATDGYRATTVRQIAADVGVNVALINRYFVSKEGLFEACMRRTSDELDTEAAPDVTGVDALVARLVAHVVNAPDGDDPLQLLLLMRSSGDENADRVRRSTLEHFTQKLAASAGWSPEHPDTAQILLRAQIAIATMVGVVMLRTSAATDPIATAGADELAGPLGQVFRLLLGAPAG